jgi:hypothetical protein
MSVKTGEAYFGGKNEPAAVVAGITSSANDTHETFRVWGYTMKRRGVYRVEKKKAAGVNTGGLGIRYQLEIRRTFGG